MRTLEELAKAPARAIRESVRGRTKVFSYTAAPITVAAISGTNPGTNNTLVNVDGDSHFMVTHLTGWYVIQATGLVGAPVLYAEPRIQIIDESTGVNLFDRFVCWGNIIGTGEEPMDFDPPYLLRARSAARVQYENYETVAYTIEVTFWGYKVFLR